MRTFLLLIICSLLLCGCQEYSNTTIADNSPIKITISGQGISIQQIPFLNGEKTVALTNGLIHIDVLSEPKIKCVLQNKNGDILKITNVDGVTQTYKRWSGVINPDSSFQPTDIYFCSDSGQYLKYDILGDAPIISKDKFMNENELISQINEICGYNTPLKLNPIIIRIAYDPRSFDENSFLVYHRASIE